jgi:hypothetical protein
MKIHARRYNRFRDRREGDAADEGEGDELDDEQLEEPVRKEDTQDEEERGRTMVTPKKTRSRKEPESTVDILYENQRGGFLCGIPLFSAQALGSLDPPPWTNAAFKPSATDITNAQVPDPSWQWAWKEWVINRQEGIFFCILQEFFMAWTALLELFCPQAGLDQEAREETERISGRRRGNE